MGSKGGQRITLLNNWMVIYAGCKSGQTKPPAKRFMCQCESTTDLLQGILLAGLRADVPQILQVLVKTHLQHLGQWSRLAWCHIKTNLWVQATLFTVHFDL